MPSNLHFLTTYLRPQRRAVLLLALALLSSILLQLLNPQILKGFIDAATSRASGTPLAPIAGLFLGVAVAQQVAALGATYLSENVGWRATNALRTDLLLHCLRLDPSFHKAHPPGELIDRIDGDASALSGFFSEMILQVAGNLLLLLGVLAILCRTDGRVGLVMGLFAVLAVATMGGVQRIAAPLWTVARQRSAELYGFLEERLQGREDIRSAGAENYTMRRFFERTREWRRAEGRARVAGQLGWVLPDLLFTLGTAASYLVLARVYRTHAITIGAVYAVFYYAGLLTRPLSQLARHAEQFQKASAAITRIHSLFDVHSAIQDAGAAALPDGPLAVSFENVRLEYEPGQPALDRVTFRLDAGHTLGLLGRSGSGKTTLTRLLFRLYDPQEGVIRLADTDIRDVPLRALRERIAIVTQEVQLFAASVRDNLTLFDPTVPDARLLEAIESLGLLPWLRALPQGLDTPLSSGGGLSAGEAQLLALTRAFLRDPGLLILDEASSRLDPATERLIERALETLLIGRTGIIIAHRLQTVQRTDRILVLEDGKILEYGERPALQDDPNSAFARLLRTGGAELLG